MVTLECGDWEHRARQQPKVTPELILAAEPGTTIALLDRNDLTKSEWRRVIAFRLTTSSKFILFTEEGELIHEPAHSWCVPDDGQEAEELAAEIPDYHRGPEVEDRQHERCDGGDRLAADASDTTADATGVVNAATADSAEAVAAAASERDGERTAAEIASGEADADATSPPSVVSERQPSAGEGADVPAVMGAVTVTLPDWLIDGARVKFFNSGDKHWYGAIVAPIVKGSITLGADDGDFRLLHTG